MKVFIKSNTYLKYLDIPLKHTNNYKLILQKYFNNYISCLNKKRKLVLILLLNSRFLISI